MNKAYSVTQVNEYISKKLRDDYNLRNIPIEGEISGFGKSGPHYYFTVKDAGSMLKCAIWASNAANIDMKLLENGKKVILLGDISPYAKGGSYSFSVRYVEAVGDGDLMAEYNRVKKLLEDEGLFDTRHKKPIPEFPLRVGIVTSSTGAAIEDIKKIITAKNNLTDILIFPTQVQGIGAPGSICENIVLANNLNKNGLRIDTLIVGRGGGSAEDLMAFNDENVARTIFASEIPVISAVGHESDVSISDFVADARAETPTAAADMAVMNTFELRDFIEDAKYQLIESVKLKIQSERNLLDTRSRLVCSYMRNKLNDAGNSIDKAVITLKENDPRNIFGKGYSALFDSDGNVIKSVDYVKIDDNVVIRMHDGTLKAIVSDIERN